MAAVGAVTTSGLLPINLDKNFTPEISWMSSYVETGATDVKCMPEFFFVNVGH